MTDHQLTRTDLEAAQRGGNKIVYNKGTGQFEVLKSYERVDPAMQTEMVPSNIPNALRVQ